MLIHAGRRRIGWMDYLADHAAIVAGELNMAHLIDYFIQTGNFRDTLKFDVSDAVASNINLLYYNSIGALPEPEVTRTMERLIRPGDTVIDAGANIGFFTVFMSRLVGPTGTVIAIEPDPDNLRRLRRNLKLNECGNVEIYPVAIGRLNECAILHRMEENGMHSTSPKAPTDAGAELGTIDVTQLTLPSILDGRKAKVMKMDIEGAELDALRAFGAFGDSIPIRFIFSELNREALARFGYSVNQFREWVYMRNMAFFNLRMDGGWPAMMRDTQMPALMRANSNILLTNFNRLAEAWPLVEI